MGGGNFGGGPSGVFGVFGSNAFVRGGGFALTFLGLGLLAPFGPGFFAAFFGDDFFGDAFFDGFDGGDFFGAGTLRAIAL